MKAFTKFVIMSAMIAILAVSGFAQDDEVDLGMGPLGAPDEIKSFTWIIGIWDVAMEWKMAPEDTVWVPSTAVSVYSFEIDSCVIRSTFESSFMGMNMNGLFLQTYDRPKKEFQSIWVDNFAARMSLYTGNKNGNSTTMTGEEIDPTGAVVLSRITTYNETSEKFDWKMEMSSDGGENWTVAGRAVYTKRK